MTEGSPGRAAALALAGLVRRYGEVAALDGVDLAVAAGELLTILGPSGSGKSTLLKAVAGFEPLDAGRVVLDGADITGLTPARRSIGMVFQNYALFPHMSVAANVAFPLKMRRRPRAEIARAVAGALDLVALGGFEARYPAQLSGGQQQRVALARAIVFAPKLLLLDEPLGALDRKLRGAMQIELRRLQKQLGITTIFITHDQEEALLLSDRIAVMRQGRILQLGRPRELYERPADAFIADFVGESNLWRGRVVAVAGGQARVAIGSGTQLAAAANAAAGDEVLLVLRPETPQPARRQPAWENRQRGTVSEALYLGAALRYRVALESGVELVLRWPAQGEAPLGLGAAVELAWPAAELHLLRER